MKKRLFSLLLVLCMVASMFTFGVQPAAVADSNPHDQIQGSNILHCFNWSYNEIRANLQAIKDAGYTAIQTSPVQPAKSYNNSWNDTKGQWWKLYQPLDIRIANGNETWLGSKEELTALCTEADALDLYVIVDIVANHVANKESGGYTLNGVYNVSTQVADRLQDPDGSKNLYHTSTAGASDTNRTTMTQNHISMPDLNTDNSDVQQMVLRLLKQCVDCGVDGFRFDAAKHIELPTDSGCGSDFWPDVLGRIRTYAGADNLYIYGEALYTIGTATENYTQYMAITDNVTGNNACTAVKNGNAGALAVNGYDRGESPADYVLWAESHDTYEDDATSGVSSDKIIRTWAIVGARAYSTALFLARPNERMGLASTDTSWKSPAVAAVNKFKTYFDGTGEWFSYDADSNNITMLERGTAGSGAGAVIVKLDGAGWVVDLPVYLMSDGVYADEVTGNVFSVSNGKITGEVGPTGAAVVYKTSTGTVPTPPATNRTLYLEVNDSWTQGNERYAAYVWNSSGNHWYSMSPVSGESNLYSVVIPTSYTSIIFCRMNGSTTENNWSNKWEQTADLTIPTDGKNLFTVADDVWDGATTTWSTFGGGSNPTPTPTATPAATEGYYLVGNMNSWAVDSAYKLTQNTGATGTTEYYIEDVSLTTTSQFKIVYSADGSATTTWYPDGLGNQYTVDAAHADRVNIYFKTTYDSAWSAFGGYMWIEQKPLVTLENVRYAYSLTLGDSILINERVFFPENTAYDVSKFAVAVDFGGTVQTIPLTESLRDNDVTISGVKNHVYKFVAADCVAKQVTDDAVITFLYDGNPVANDAGTAVRSYTISVRSYCEDNLKENSTASAKLKALCGAVLSYGAAAQTRFNYKTDDLANKTYSVENPSTSIPVSYQKQAATGSCSAVLDAAISLVLESRTQINFYIKPASGYTAEQLMGMLTVKLGDETVTNYTTTTVTAEGTMQGALLVTVTGIAAKNLDDVYAVSVGNDTYGTKTWYQSPLNYAYDAQSNATEGALVLALYDYFLTAKAYMTNN